MSDLMLSLSALDGIAPEASAPAPDRIISGNPQFQTWDVDAQPGDFYAGIWESTPGKWRIEYTEWEYFRVLSGVSIVTEDNGEARRFGPGDAAILRPGFKGTWEVVETTRKDYVVRL